MFVCRFGFWDVSNEHAFLSESGSGVLSGKITATFCQELACGEIDAVEILCGAQHFEFEQCPGPAHEKQ